MNTIEEMKQRLQSRFLSYLESMTMPEKAEPQTKEDNAPPNSTGNKTKEMRKLKYGKTYHSSKGLAAAKANVPA